MSIRILIAEDYDQLRRMMRHTLVEAGYRVIDVADGTAANAALIGGGFALAILDSRMPGMTGGEVLTAARERGDQTPVMLVSGSLTAEDIPNVSPSAYLLPKPFEFDDLVATVDQLIARHASADRTQPQRS